MDKQELIREAKKRYRTGDYINSLSLESGTIDWEEMSSYQHESPSHSNQGLWLGLHEYAGNRRVQVYDSNTDKWAGVELTKSKNNTKVLIFNDMYVGDIVVCPQRTNKSVNSRNDGDIYKVLDKSRTGDLYYKEGACSSESRDWRKATPEEIEAYNKGIRNIKDIVKTPQFEVGKWYKLGLRSYDHKILDRFIHFIKFKEIFGNTIKYTESIDLTTPKYHADSNNSSIDLTNVTSHRLVIDLSEIQQYLPDGHIDKIKKVIAPINGRCYVAPSTGNICRWKDNNSDYYFGGSNEHPNTYFNIGIGGFKVNDLRDATPDEEKWLLTCILANKFIPKEEALKSSKIELIPSKWYECIQTGIGWKWIIEIDRLDGNYIYHRRCCSISKDGKVNDTYKNNGWGDISVGIDWKPADMELVYKHFPEERPKEQVMEDLVGRWVKILRNPYSSENKDTAVGVYLKITNCSKDIFNTVSQDGIYTDFWNTENRLQGSNPTFELMPIGWNPNNQEIMNAHGLKVGDRLENKILNSYSGIVGNWCKDIHTGWGGKFASYFGDKTIESFKLINGIIAFKVSNCSINTHYIKAEGFKEYMEEFNKPKNPLEELWEEAKRRYPIGTKFRVVHRPDHIVTVSSHEKYADTFLQGQNRINILVSDSEDCKGATVYLDGKWAEVVSQSCFDTEKLTNRIQQLSKVELITKYDDILAIDTKVEQFKPIKTELILN